MKSRLARTAMLWIAALSSAQAAEIAYAPLYYQAPDGQPYYAAAPKKTTAGRDYAPVYVDTPAVSPKRAHRILYYRNPMGLPDTSTVPKKDSMGMEYLPVYADENTAGDAPGTVRISPGRIQTLGVRTAPVVLSASLDRAIQATGTVQFDERHLATVTTKVAGWIELLAVSAVGDPVRRGEVLAEIYAPDLVASEEEYLVATRMDAGMSATMAHGDPAALAAASLQRLRALDVPEEEIARLRHSGTPARRIAVRAPEDGVVIDKPVQEGMRVEPGEALYKTADLADVWLIAEVQEQDLGAIRQGARAVASFIAFPGRSFEGIVDFIYPTLSPETRTARVRIVIPNADRALRIAMYASVRIEIPLGNAAMLTVPDSAVIDTGTQQIVLIARGEGRFEPRQVHLGARGEARVQVLDGLKPGDTVVIGANFLIDAESNLRAALQGLATGASAKPGPEPQGDSP